MCARTYTACFLLRQTSWILSKENAKLVGGDAAISNKHTLLQSQINTPSMDNTILGLLFRTTKTIFKFLLTRHLSTKVLCCCPFPLPNAYSVRHCGSCCLGRVIAFSKCHISVDKWKIMEGLSMGKTGRSTCAGARDMAWRDGPYGTPNL